MNQRLEDRIRELCLSLVSCEDEGPEFHKLAVELRASLAEHIERLRAKLTEYPASNDRRAHGSSPTR